MPRKPADKEAILKRAADGGTQRDMARDLGIHYNTVNRVLKEANVSGKVYARSALYKTHLGEGEDGVVLEWIKTKEPPVDREALVKAIKEELKGIRPLPAIKAPRIVLENLMNAYPMGDPHIGQYSWAAETGDDYDVAIATKLHVNAMDVLVSIAPAAQTAIVVNIGDYFHANDHKNRTPQSQHALDVDTRHRRVVASGLAIQRRQIERALQKHEKVYVYNVPGNHDPESSAFLPLALGMLFENNPRVVIDQSPAKFLYHRHGEVLIGMTHGDTVKLEKLGELMANDQREAWGATTHHHWFTGHLHNRRFHEGVGWTGEVLRTLAGKDAYAASHAYRSGRDMQCVVFDAFDGEVGRHRVLAGKRLLEMGQ
jgi:hypothetical protein